MLYTIFNENGYKIRSDIWKKNLSNVDNYDWLFDFLGVNLNQMDIDFEARKNSLLDCLKKIDKRTFGESDLNLQGKKMKIVHPFYGMIIEEEHSPFYGFSEGTKYFTEQLLFILFDELSIQNNKNEILNEINEHKEIIKFFKPERINNLSICWYSDIVKKYRDPFSYQFFLNLIILQQKLLSWSFLFLDLDAKYLNQLNKKQRIGMYGFFSNSILNIKEVVENTLFLKNPISYNSIPDITVTERRYFSNLENNVSMVEYDGKKMWSPGQNGKHLKVLCHLQMAYMNPDHSNISSMLKCVVEKFESNFTIGDYWSKEIISIDLLALLEYEFSRLLE